MKKIRITLIIAILGYSTINGQEDTFGLSAGYGSLTTELKISYDGNSESTSDSAGGFYIGLFKEFYINEKLAIRPEFQYAMYNSDGDNSSVFLLPVMLKFKIVNSLYVSTGPQFDYLLENDVSADEINKFGLGLAFGTEVDLTKKLFINLRYSFGVSERLKNDDILEPIKIDARFDTFNLGLGYHF